jgi:hypothetical protein
MTTISVGKITRYRHKEIKHNYTCTLIDQRISKLARSQGDKTNYSHNDLLADVQNQQPHDSFISIEEA